MPDYEERKTNAIKFYRYVLVMIIDGVEQEIEMKVNKKVAKLTRSGKKEKYTVTKLAGVSPQGKLMMFSRTYRGALNDMNLVHNPFTTQLVANLQKGECVGAYKGFIGLEDVWTNVDVVVPFKKYNNKLHPTKQRWNNDLKKIRTVVENYFAQLKDFKILRNKFRANGSIDEVTEKHHRIWVVCAGIMDQFIFSDGVRM